MKHIMYWSKLIQTASKNGENHAGNETHLLKKANNIMFIQHQHIIRID